MAPAPVIQVLEKNAYYTQHLVSLPDALPLPPLAESSIRIKTEIVSLTSNNVTYAKLGFLLGWWAFHPLPPTTPAPYNDETKYGRISAWGYAKVLESKFEAAPAGSYLFGYLPIGTLPQDLEVGASEAPGQVIVTSAYRKELMAIYNRYLVVPEDQISSDITAKSKTVAYESLFRVLFETSYLLNRFVFTGAVHPGMVASAPWTHENADLTDATVVVIAPGSKTGLSFAHELRQSRENGRPKQIIGVASEFSRAFVEGTGLYDEVLPSDHEAIDQLATRWGVSKLMLVDFGGRSGVAQAWFNALGSQVGEGNRLFLRIGSEISELKQEDALKGLQGTGEGVTANANDMRERAMAKVGHHKYFVDLQSAWEKFRGDGIKGFKVNWGENMEDVEKGWERLCKGEVKPDEGLVYRI